MHQDFREVFILNSIPEYLDELSGLGTTDVIDKFIVEPRLLILLQMTFMFSWN